jgi:hypothetical protein
MIRRFMSRPFATAAQVHEVTGLDVVRIRSDLIAVARNFDRWEVDGIAEVALRAEIADVDTDIAGQAGTSSWHAGAVTGTADLLAGELLGRGQQWKDASPNGPTFTVDATTSSVVRARPDDIALIATSATIVVVGEQVRASAGEVGYGAGLLLALIFAMIRRTAAAGSPRGGVAARRE